MEAIFRLDNQQSTPLEYARNYNVCEIVGMNYGLCNHIICIMRKKNEKKRRDLPITTNQSTSPAACCSKTIRYQNSPRWRVVSVDTGQSSFIHNQSCHIIGYWMQWSRIYFTGIIIFFRRTRIEARCDFDYYINPYVRTISEKKSTKHIILSSLLERIP